MSSTSSLSVTSSLGSISSSIESELSTRRRFTATGMPISFVSNKFIEGDFDEYVKNIQRNNAWGGEPELLMASHVLRMSISVFKIDKSSRDLIYIASYSEEYGKDESPIKVVFHGYGHYNVLEIFSEKV
ncbi:hypothetical protein GIB67_026989 [Kingdonia uniflora]|uniref:Ubiquitin thioesterase OTU n=1 Tax=Kingdonia uniflora TaxID=39325 RepID=A0A7J7P288_9MAGN|nr:hypothetical protein GIB67_026989 [Kingdonia uniflora]